MSRPEIPPTVRIARAGEELGEFSVEDVVRGLESGQFLDSDWMWWIGLTEWKPLHECVPITPATNLATPRQIALLKYLSIEIPRALTTDAASSLIEAAQSDNQLRSRLRRWTHERLILHPDLYEEERGWWKDSRAEELHEWIGESEFECLFENLSRSDVKNIVEFLDAKVDDWDVLWRDPYHTGINAALVVDCILPAAAIRCPQKLIRKLRGGYVNEDNIKAPTKVAEDLDYLDQILELRP